MRLNFDKYQFTAQYLKEKLRDRCLIKKSIEEIKDLNRQIIKVTKRFQSRQNKKYAALQYSSDLEKQPTSSKPNIFNVIRNEDVKNVVFCISAFNNIEMFP